MCNNICMRHNMFTKYNTRLSKQSKLNELYSKPNIELVQDTSLCDKAPSTNIHNSRACVCVTLLLYIRPGPQSNIIMVTPSGVYSWGPFMESGRGWIQAWEAGSVWLWLGNVY